MIGRHVDNIHVRLYLWICIWIYRPTCRNKCNWCTLKHLVLVRIKGFKKSPKIPGNTFSNKLLKSRSSRIFARFFLAGVTEKKWCAPSLIFCQEHWCDSCKISPDHLEICKMRTSVRGKRKMDYWLWNPLARTDPYVKKLFSHHNPRTNSGVLHKCPTWDIIPGRYSYPWKKSPDYLEIWKMRTSVRGKRKMVYGLYNPSARTDPKTGSVSFESNFWKKLTVKT